MVTDAIGRKNSLLLAAVITIFGVILQTASQNVAMFVISRIIIGFGTGASGIVGLWHCSILRLLLDADYRGQVRLILLKQCRLLGGRGD